MLAALGGMTAPAPPLFFRLLMVVVPLAFVVVGGVWLVRTVPRVLRARPAEGVVVHVAETPVHDERPIWRLTVEYRDETGVLRTGVWSGDSTVDVTRYRPGMPVPVRYDPRRPGWVHLPGGGRPHPLLVPGGLVVVGLVVLGAQQVLR